MGNIIVHSLYQMTLESFILKNSLVQSGYAVVYYQTYTIIVLFGISCLTNLCVSLVFQSKSFKNQSMRIYYPIIGIADTFYLFMAIYEQVYIKLYITYYGTHFYCKVGQFFVHFFAFISVYMQTWMSIELCFSVLYPFRFTFLKKVPFQFMIVLVIIIFCAIINIPWLVFSKFISAGSSGTGFLLPTCQISYNINAIIIYHYIISIFYSLFPFTVMMISTIIIIRKLHKSTKKSKTKELKFSLIIITMNIYFVLMTLPYAIIDILKGIENPSLWDYGGTDHSIINIVSIYLSFPRYIFHATLFFIQFLFNKLFRKILFDSILYVVRCKWRKKNQIPLKFDKKRIRR